MIQIVSTQWIVGGPQPERVGSTNAQLSEIWNVNTVWSYRFSRWFSCFFASAVCLQYVTGWVFGVHSFQGKQLSYSRHISQCILSVMHDAMYQDFTVTCTSCSQSFHVLLFEFILLLIWLFKRFSSLSAVMRQLEKKGKFMTYNNFFAQNMHDQLAGSQFQDGINCNFDLASSTSNWSEFSGSRVWFFIVAKTECSTSFEWLFVPQTRLWESQRNFNLGCLDFITWYLHRPLMWSWVQDVVSSSLHVIQFLYFDCISCMHAGVLDNQLFPLPQSLSLPKSIYSPFSAVLYNFCQWYPWENRQMLCATTETNSLCLGLPQVNSSLFEPAASVYLSRQHQKSDSYHRCAWLEWKCEALVMHGEVKNNY